VILATAAFMQFDFIKSGKERRNINTAFCQALVTAKR
jgi:hypothetical protein